MQFCVTIDVGDNSGGDIDDIDDVDDDHAVDDDGADDDADDDVGKNSTFYRKSGSKRTTRRLNEPLYLYSKNTTKLKMCGSCSQRLGSLG